MLIGICGGIGSGKSVVSRILRLNGEAVYDCDFEAKRIMDTSEEVIHALHARYGDEICGPEGPIIRPALAEIIFEEEEELLWLNGLVHGLVREDLAAWSKQMKIEGRKRFFVESAILVSSGLAEMCCEVWLVTAPVYTRFKRVLARDGESMNEVSCRIAAQNKEEDMVRSLSIPVKEISNSGSEPLLPQIGFV